MLRRADHHAARHLDAWPTNVTGADLKSDGSEVTIESVDLAYETLVTSAP